MSREDYLKKYKPLAVEHMLSYNIPASITLAQAVLESSNGNSLLATKANNHFGIKCHSTWTGKTIKKDDDKKNECFRVYKNPEDSYKDHSEFLLKSRYARCFELEITNYKGWAKELKNAGYATNPKYPDLLITIIEDNELYLIDQEALGIIDQTGGAMSEKPYGPERTEQEPTQHSGEEPIDDIAWGRPEILVSDNNIKYVKATAGQTINEIADLTEKGRWEIKSYNDLPTGYVFGGGEVVYLQPKRGKSKTEAYHIVKSGETMRDISQTYGVKLKKLYRFNRMEQGTEPAKGARLWLQSKKPVSET